MKPILFLVILGGAARADLGDARAVSISDDFSVGGAQLGWSSGLTIRPALDWFPLRGLSVGAELGGGVSWSAYAPAIWGWSVGARVGYAFRLPDRWTIWPRVGMEAYGMTSAGDGHSVVGDALLAKLIGHHLYLGMRAEIVKPSFVDAPFVAARAVIGATF
jgi:hypothetical protein